MYENLSKLYLSERNLRTLLSKLERRKLGDETQCAIIKYRQDGSSYCQTMDSVMVIAVEDEIYYPAQHREPGPVYPLDTP